MNKNIRDIDKNTIKKHVIRLSILSVAVIAWLTLIFGFSSDSATDSSKKSGELLVAIVNLVAPSLDATMENYQSIEELQNCEKLLRKCAHMIEYGVFALILWLLICEINFFVGKNLGRNGIYPYILAELGVSVVGTIDEINQTRFIGRYGSPADVFIDAAGGAIFLLIICFINMGFKIPNETHKRSG